MTSPKASKCGPGNARRPGRPNQGYQRARPLGVWPHQQLGPGTSVRCGSRVTVASRGRSPPASAAAIAWAISAKRARRLPIDQDAHRAAADQARFKAASSSVKVKLSTEETHRPSFQDRLDFRPDVGLHAATAQGAGDAAVWPDQELCASFCGVRALVPPPSPTQTALAPQGVDSLPELHHPSPVALRFRWGIIWGSAETHVFAPPLCCFLESPAREETLCLRSSPPNPPGRRPRDDLSPPFSRRCRPLTVRKDGEPVNAVFWFCHHGSEGDQ